MLVVEIPPELDRVAHERRVRLIAELYRRALATANDLSAQHKTGAGTTNDAGRRSRAWMSIAGAFIVALGSILALLAMMQ